MSYVKCVSSSPNLRMLEFENMLNAYEMPGNKLLHSLSLEWKIVKTSEVRKFPIKEKKAMSIHPHSP